MSLFGNGTGEPTSIPTVENLPVAEETAPDATAPADSTTPDEPYSVSNSQQATPGSNASHASETRSKASGFDSLFDDADYDGMDLEDETPQGQLTPPETPAPGTQPSPELSPEPEAQPESQQDLHPEEEEEQDDSDEDAKSDTLSGTSPSDGEADIYASEEEPQPDALKSESQSTGFPTTEDPDVLGLFVSDDEDALAEGDAYPSPPSSPDPSRYLLRQGPRQNQQHHAGWLLDQDESGYYNPRARAPRRKPASRHPEKRKRIAPEPRSDDERREPKAAPTLLFSRQSGLQLAVTLKSEAEEWRSKLRELKNDASAIQGGATRGQDNWPAEGSEDEPNFTNIDIKNILTRKRLIGKHKMDHTEEIQLGDLCARGCKGCVEVGSIDCTLIDGGQYPCDSCEDAGELCELIVEPELKDSCEQCGQEGQCSFKTNRSQEGPCDNCRTNEWLCVAGPWGGITSLHPRLGDAADVHKAKLIMWKTENAARAERNNSDTRSSSQTDTSNTSTRSNSEDPNGNPKTSRKKKKARTDGTDKQQKKKKKKPKKKYGAPRHPQLPNRPGYTRYSIPFRQHVHADVDINKWVSGPPCIKMETFFAGDDTDSDEEDADEPFATAGPSDITRQYSGLNLHDSSTDSESAGSRYLMSGALPPPPKKIGSPRLIRTRLTHPIKINHDSWFDCDWCSEDPVTRAKIILGLPERQLHVQETEDGYLLEGGIEPDDTALRSKMCYKHTMDRFSVGHCPHQLSLIPGATAAELLEMMHRVMDPSMGQIPMCSICPRAAIARCEKYGLLQQEQEALGQTPDEGCGLFCCLECMKGLDRHGDSVVAFVESKMNSLALGSVGEIRGDAEMFGHVCRRLAVLAHGAAEGEEA